MRRKKLVFNNSTLSTIATCAIVASTFLRVVVGSVMDGSKVVEVIVVISAVVGIVVMGGEL